eukprot:GCRY01004384.1.p1 GENE.GCRY01004384.1~~GCRY01004384.1.p1  ORF type:complete len:254 (+),score=29.59 GCRY01004384.1:74-835(+)
MLEWQCCCCCNNKSNGTGFFRHSSFQSFRNSAVIFDHFPFLSFKSDTVLVTMAESAQEFFEEDDEFSVKLLTDAEFRQIFNGREKREVGNGATWTLSSAKIGHGIEELRDNNTETFWQSDASQPHTVTMVFQERTTVTDLLVYLDYKADESYTPSSMAVHAGSDMHHLKELDHIDVMEPVGWIRIPLSETRKSNSPCLSTFILQLGIITNHQNGKDTHVRQVKVFGPNVIEDNVVNFEAHFSSPEFLQYRALR